MSKALGETMLFSGGAECTPKVTVSRFHMVGSLHNNEPALLIDTVQGRVLISPQTMKDIISWYEGGSTT